MIQRLRKKNTTTPKIPPAEVDNHVSIKVNPNPKDRAGAIRNLILLTANTIIIFTNPDKVQMLLDNNV